MKEYKKTFLRALCPDDIKVLYSWFNDIEIAKFNGIPFRFHTKEDLKRKFFAHENQLLNYSLMICNNKKKPLGVIRYRKNRLIIQELKFIYFGVIKIYSCIG